MTSGTATVAVSGWGQPHDALRAILPDARHLHYAHTHSAAEALTLLQQDAKGCDLAVGWSLGGQLLVRAVAAGMFRPRHLVLLATPFQFVRRPSLPLGMPTDLFSQFYDNYAADAQRTLTKAWATLVKGDRNSAQIRRHLDGVEKQSLTQLRWKEWLSELERFSCEGLHMADFPPTLLIHGREDAVVYHEQSLMLKHAIPHADILTLEGCGHAPHWHDSDKIKQAIAHFIGNTTHV